MHIFAFAGAAILAALGCCFIYCGYIQISARLRCPSSGCRYRGAKWPGRGAWVLLGAVAAFMLMSGADSTYFLALLLLGGGIFWADRNIRRMFVRIENSTLVFGGFLGERQSVRITDIAEVEVRLPAVLVLHVKQAQDVVIPALFHNMPGLLAALSNRH